MPEVMFRWKCGCGEVGYPHSHREVAVEYGEEHEADCPFRVVVEPIEPLELR